MRKLTLCLLLVATLSSAQHHGSPYPTPPADAQAGSLSQTQPATSASPRTDPVQLERDAKELLSLAQSLQPDIASINHGLLPKDTLAKLKRIEKLSKHLRSELTP